MSPPSSDLLWPLECRTCHDRALVHVTDIRDPDDFQVVHRCKVCGYLNVIGQHRLVLPISESLEGLTAPGQDSIRAALEVFIAEPSGRTLRGLLDSYVQHLDALVKQQLQEAAAALLLAMRERERSLAPLLEDGLGVRNSAADLHAKVVSRCTDLLYLLLRQSKPSTPLVVASPAATEAVVSFFRVFSTIATDAAALALQSHGIDAGMWRCAATSGTVVVASTDTHDRVAEWDLNRRQFDGVIDASRRSHEQPSMDVASVFASVTTEAERQWLGFDSVDILRLIAGLRDKGAVREFEGGIWVIELGPLADNERMLLGPLVLDPERAQRFAVPFYFDLGSERPASSLLEAASRALTSNWTNYYPIYASSDTNGRPILFTSKMPLIVCFSNMETFRNKIFQRIKDVAKGAAISAKLARLDKRLKRRLEDATAEAATQSGWHTLLRLKKDLNGRDLECGEIDLLCAKVIRGTVVVLLAEVKDIDLTPISWPGGLSGMQSKLGVAFRQLSRRSRWLSSAWVAWVRASILKERNAAASTTYLLPLVVTARYMPPFLFDQYLGVPLAGFRMFLAGLEDGDHDRLRAIAGETLVVLETA